MKRSFSIILFFLIYTTNIFGQEKLLTIEDVIQGRHLYPESLRGVKAYGNNEFTHVKDFNEIFLMNTNGKEEKVLADLNKINTAMAEEGLSEIKYFPYWDYNWTDIERLSFRSNGHYFVFNITTGKIELKSILPDGSENINACTENKLTAFTVKNNLYFIDGDGNKTTVTNDDNPGIVNGSNYVHRQEFGIDNGIFWSPKGHFLAYYRKDETMVSDYPLVDITTRIAELNNIKYPMNGEKSEEVTLGIYDLSTGKTVFADVTDFTPERYLTSITWGPNEEYIYIGVLNRGQDHLKLNKYDAKTGKFIKTLFEEKNDRYVEPEHQLIFTDGLKDQFLWYSDRDGYNHLYLYDTEGKLIRQLTKGESEVTDFLGFTPDLKTFFITGTKDSPTGNYAYSVDFKNGKISGITNEPGTHNVVFSNSKKYFFDSYSNIETPNVSSIKDANGKLITETVRADNPLKDYKLGTIKNGTLKSADGKTDLYWRLVLPPDLDESKKYPVIVYVYGGPHAQLVTNSWMSGGLWNHYMAQKGYIMFTIDNRGSANRGFEFESIIHRQLGQAEMKDQMKGIEFLKSLPYTDQDRIGVHGWSYGGFMTTSMMINYPEIFKVGVAGGPVIDWKYYEVMYGERYMDTYQENPEGFEKINLLDHADKLKGRLMIIHGYQDPVVLPQLSINFLRSCIKAGTDADFFLYPESEHNMRGEKRVHLMKKVTRYFDDFL